MRARGFSLLELMISCFLFTSLSMLVFSFFRFGTRSFQTANQKNGLQTDALRSIESLQAELKRTSQSSVYLKNDSARDMTLDGATVHRDVICFATLKNWKDKTSSENFDVATGAPKWNRYVVFYATKEEEGRLVRLRVDPNPPPEAPIQMIKSEFEKLYHDTPESNIFDGTSPAYTALAKNVYNFDIGPLEQGAYPITLKLREKHSAEAVEPGARRPFDYYELRLRVAPENSLRNDI